MNALPKLAEWSKELPDWLSDMARRAILKGALDSSDLEDSEALLLTSIGIADSENRTAIRLDPRMIPVPIDSNDAISLSAIREPLHVNALDTKTVLTFGDSGLTVIFGPNGAGKSGFTRILKNACRSRDQEQILPNVFATGAKQASGGEPKLISNNALKDALGWTQERYNRIKQELLGEKKIIVGRGYGGSVSLAIAPGSNSLKVFISYCHSDESSKADLIKHLTPLKRLDLVEVWHDRKIPAGGEWAQEISAHLEKADIILMLVSIDFINSQYCYDIELERALERHEEKSAIVIPIILRSCMWQHTPFSKLQALPKDGKPVCCYDDKDEAFTEIATSIKQAEEQLLASK